MKAPSTNNTPELREQCAGKLHAAEARAQKLRAFLGLDGFVDEIVHVVDKREHADSFERMTTITRLAERLAAAAGKSTNLELVTQRVKLGGNGPIMANALAAFGVQVTYLGALGYPNLHPVFHDFARQADVHSIAEPGHTDALEFEDGKIMLGKSTQLNEITWPNIQARFGRDKFVSHFTRDDLVGFVNWTMIPYMSDVWDSLLTEICPDLEEPRRKIFFDLADPEKRTSNDIARVLELIVRFTKYFDVILGLNEKEAYALGKVLRVAPKPRTAQGLAGLAREISQRLPVDTLVVHPVAYAVAVHQGVANVIDGPLVEKPLITTGAGDHFNSGFCLGKLLGLDNALCVLTGVTTSGFYVRTAKSPSIADLVHMLRNWPAN